MARPRLSEQQQMRPDQPTSLCAAWSLAIGCAATERGLLGRASRGRAAHAVPRIQSLLSGMPFVTASHAPYMKRLYEGEAPGQPAGRPQIGPIHEMLVEVHSIARIADSGD